MKLTDNELGSVRSGKFNHEKLYDMISCAELGMDMRKFKYVKCCESNCTQKAIFTLTSSTGYKGDLCGEHLIRVMQKYNSIEIVEINKNENRK